MEDSVVPLKLEVTNMTERQPYIEKNVDLCLHTLKHILIYFLKTCVNYIR